MALLGHVLAAVRADCRRDDLGACSTTPTISARPEYLTFGRLRPVHVNGVIFGAFSTLFIGLCYYLVPRLCGVRVPWPSGSAAGWPGSGTSSWRCGLLSLTLGYNQGLEAGEFPLFAEIADLRRAAPSLTWQFTDHDRPAPGAAALRQPLVPDRRLRVDDDQPGPRHFILPYTIPGINSAAFHGLFIHYIVGLWITPAGYVLIYYFLPVSARNPLYSHKLSLVGFWSLALFYPFVGIHHYLYSPIADWAETLAIITSMLLIIPVWTVLVNFFGTMNGRWHDLRHATCRRSS